MNQKNSLKLCLFMYCCERASLTNIRNLIDPTNCLKCNVNMGKSLARHYTQYTTRLRKPKGVGLGI